MDHLHNRHLHKRAEYSGGQGRRRERGGGVRRDGVVSFENDTFGGPQSPSTNSRPFTVILLLIRSSIHVALSANSTILLLDIDYFLNLNLFSKPCVCILLLLIDTVSPTATNETNQH